MSEFDDFSAILDDYKKEIEHEKIANIVRDVEEEFKTGAPPVEFDRKREYDALLEQKKVITKKIAKIKNVRNHKATQVNAAFHQKREKLRRELAVIILRLEEIDLEIEEEKKGQAKDEQDRKEKEEQDKRNKKNDYSVKVGSK